MRRPHRAAHRRRGLGQARGVGISLGRCILRAEPDDAADMGARIEAHRIAPITETDLLRGYARSIGVRDIVKAARRTGDPLLVALAQEAERLAALNQTCDQTTNTPPR
jgi:hypothetical protein